MVSALDLLFVSGADRFLIVCSATCLRSSVVSYAFDICFSGRYDSQGCCVCSMGSSTRRPLRRHITSYAMWPARALQARVLRARLATTQGLSRRPCDQPCGALSHGLVPQ